MDRRCFIKLMSLASGGVALGIMPELIEHTPTGRSFRDYWFKIENVDLTDWVTNVALESRCDLLNITDPQADQVTRFVPGLRSASGSIELLCLPPKQLRFLSEVQSRLVKFELGFVHGRESSHSSWSFNGIITNFEPSFEYGSSKTLIEVRVSGPVRSERGKV